MKTKKFAKKLVLNKKTIAHLNNDDMHSLFGGITGSCDTCGATVLMCDTLTECTELCGFCTAGCTIPTCWVTSVIVGCIKTNEC